ncbi:MAG: DUF2795 domain-containing protein [Streptomyces sp.]|uniref:DUF2795 domain-containing protein n=1 Tax=Streptomyces sp. TaxID=1931 RepID=UPI003D6B5946
MADNMQRGSDQLSAHRDDEAKREIQGRLKAGHPTRAEEWADPEPAADDDPEITVGQLPVPGTSDREELADEALRSDLARHLGRHSFPADRRALERSLLDEHAPEPLVETVRELPGGRARYGNVQEVMVALGRKPQA